MLDFVLFTCSYGMVTDQTVKCVEELHHLTDYRFEWQFQTGDALISRSRSIAAYRFLKENKAPYMIFLDGDICFKPGDITRLFRGLEQGYDVLGGLYPVRGGGFLAQRGWDGSFRVTGEIEEVQFVSTGFVGISRTLLEKMAEGRAILNKGTWSECQAFFESGEYEDIYISEDWDFCNKARIAGAKVYAHTGIQLSHLKEKIFTTQETLEKVSWNPDREDIRVDLAEFLNTTVEELIPQGIAREQISQKWNERDGLGTEDFYRNPEVGMLYLYDLAGFNSSEYYRTQRTVAVKNADHLHILDVGCGIGTLLLDLSSRNKTLLGYDLNPKLLEFAQFRREKLGAVNLQFTNVFPEDISKFDLVVAVDTLEHIEDLHTFLLKIGQGMKEGARLYHYDCFWEHEMSPMHFDHSADVKDWLKEAGLVIFDEHWCVKGGK